MWLGPLCLRDRKITAGASKIPRFAIDEHSILVVRGSGPVGYPGSAEVVNMTPPGRLIRQGIRMLPCMGDGRQSGTSDSPSILNISPESAIGGNLAILRTGDQIKVDLAQRRVDVLLSEEEIAARRKELKPAEINQPLAVGGVLPVECWPAGDRRLPGICRQVSRLRKVVPRHSH